MNKDEIYISTTASDAAEVARRWGFGIELRNTIDKELNAQAIDLLLYEECYLNEHFNRNNCILKASKKSLREKGVRQ